MDRIEASYSDIGQNGANPCALARVKGEEMPETTDLRATDTRTDGDSSANISGFAVQMLSTPDVNDCEPAPNGMLWELSHNKNFSRPFRIRFFDKDYYAFYLEKNGIVAGPSLDKSKWPKEASPEYFERLQAKGANLSYTYFAIAQNTSRIKIGKSVDPCRRVTNLGYQQCESIHVAATLRGEDFEQLYLDAFADHRIEGEWFCPHPDILAEIDRIKAGMA